MAEALAVTAVALATPPCIHATTKIWVKIAGMLHLSSPAQCNYLLSLIRHTINKSRTELEKGRRAMPPDSVKDFEDKLNKTIDLYNQLVTSHSTAHPKTRLDSAKAAQKASAGLKDIKNCSRKCGDAKLVHAVKTCLYFSKNIQFPDGTIATYHSEGARSRDSQLPGEVTVSQTANSEPGAAQTPPVLVPAPENVVNEG
ncbi:hypothetical protein DL96DRAFT_1631825 [Flagelloscypha sp. PMI_526]|nr:hypothetical protein DL96DRAFT_1631825 [Flagelloscypha sp. PMI_526]